MLTEPSLLTTRLRPLNEMTIGGLSNFNLRNLTTFAGSSVCSRHRAGHCGCCQDSPRAPHPMAVCGQDRGNECSKVGVSGTVQGWQREGRTGAEATGRPEGPGGGRILCSTGHASLKVRAGQFPR